MKAADVMVTNVITVGPDASVQDVAEILLSARISGVRRRAGGELLGIVSEGDLMHRAEAGDPAAPVVAGRVSRQGGARGRVREGAPRRVTDVTPARW